MTGSTSTGPSSGFGTTHWSVVLAAGRSDTPHAQDALARLCQTYWPPLYAYVRRRGYSPHDAQDLTQEFFARLLGRQWVQEADPDKGRFRTFLLTALSRFLANEWDRLRAQKRGGRVVVMPLDTATAENHYTAIQSRATTPDQLYDREWALTLLDRTLRRLETEHERAGKSAEFTALRPCLTAERGDIAYAEVAQQLGMNEGAARTAVHRLRKRFREVFREEITQTVATPDEVEGEIRHLIAVLAGG